MCAWGGKSDQKESIALCSVSILKGCKMHERGVENRMSGVSGREGIIKGKMSSSFKFR